MSSMPEAPLEPPALHPGATILLASLTDGFTYSWSFYMGPTLSSSLQSPPAPTVFCLAPLYSLLHLLAPLGM